MTIGQRLRVSALVGCVLLGSCRAESARSTDSAQPAPASTALSADALLKHKMECREVGVRAEKERFPEGKNTVTELNQGLMHFESVFAYDEKLNTCLSLGGFQLIDLKSMRLTTFQATLTDTLSNRMLATYLVLGDRLAPASVSRPAFLDRARELLGEPLPAWLEQAPAR